jgi:hypothetical protein
MAIVFTIEQGAELGAYLNEKNELALKRACLSAAMRLVQHILTSVIPATSPVPVDRGMYRAGWRAVRTEEGADVYNSMPYAAIIEYGARAENIKIGRAMIDALADWAKRKGLASSDDARQVAWAIAKAMQKKGIYNGGKGLRVLERATEKVQQFLQEEYARELGRVF